MLLDRYGSIPSQGGLMLPGWSYGKKITIPANSIDADLTNFPCQVILNSSNFDFSKAKADGSDIRFTDKLFNHYKFEKVEYSNANQFAKFNVLIPTVSDLTDTEFYMWSGNPNAYNTSIEAWQDMTGKQLIYNGNVKLAPNVAKFGKAAKFDGSGDYLTIPDSEDWNFGSGDFTIDFWLNPLQVSTYNVICCQYDALSGGNYWYLEYYPQSKFYRIAILNNGVVVADYDFAFVPEANKIKHYALTRDTNGLHLYEDGRELTRTVRTAIGTSSVPNVSSPLYIGTYYNGSYSEQLSGYLDEFRISKGIARWTSNFTLPTEPYTVDAYTKLLLHFDDIGMRISSSTIGTDRLHFLAPNTITPVNTTVVEAEIKIETSGSGRCQSIGVENGTKAYYVGLKTDRIIINEISATPVTYMMNTTDRFHTYKIKFNGTTNVVLEVDGVAVSTIAYADVATLASNRILFGDLSPNASDGGSAIWKSVKYWLDYTNNPNSFTEWNSSKGLPTANGWNAQGTTSLASLVFTDETGKQVTTYGDVKPIKTAYADGARGAVYLGAQYFTLSDSEDFYFGNGEFCFEWKGIFKTLPGVGVGWSLYNQGATQTNDCIDIKLNYSTATTFTLNIRAVSGTTQTVSINSNAFAVEINKIYDIAITRVGGTIYFFVNGELSGSSASSGVFPNLSAVINMGLQPADGRYYQGYILGTRIAKGNGRYSSNYTPPSKFEIDGSDVVFCTNFDTIYSQDYAMVQHMGDSLVDATGNGNNLTNSNTIVESSTLGKCRKFNGSSAFLSMSNKNELEFVNASYTLMALLKFDALPTSAQGSIIDQADGASPYNGWSLGTANTAFNGCVNGARLVTTADGVINTSDIMMATVKNPQGQNLRMYKDGIDNTSATQTRSPSATTSQFIIGTASYSGWSSVFNGKMFGIWIANIARPDAYIKAESKALKGTLLTHSKV